MLLKAAWDKWAKINPKCSVTGHHLMRPVLERVHLGTCALVANGYLEGRPLPTVL